MRGRYHRSRHGQSGFADAAPCHRKTEGKRGQAADRSLLRVARNYRFAQGAGGLLRPALWRETEPRYPYRGDAGSKEGFANVAQAITAPGDVVLCPNPSYPIHAFGFLMAGRRDPIGTLGADARNSSRRSSAPSPHSIPKPLAIVVCYPSNPTAYVASLDFYRDLVAFAKKTRDLHSVGSRLCRGLFRRQQSAAPRCCSSRGDRCHRGIYLDVEDVFDGRLADGICRRQRTDHRSIGAGEILSRLRRIHPDPGRRDRRAERSGRLHSRDAPTPTASAGMRWWKSFGRAGWDIPPPEASMFAWAPLPKDFPRRRQHAVRNPDGFEKSGVVVSPGVAFGEHGEGYVRIAMVETEQRIRQAARGSAVSFESGIETLHNVVPLANRR